MGGGTIPTNMFGSRKLGESYLPMENQNSSRAFDTLLNCFAPVVWFEHTILVKHLQNVQSMAELYKDDTNHKTLGLLNLKQLLLENSELKRKSSWFLYSNDKVDNRYWYPLLYEFSSTQIYIPKMTLRFFDPKKCFTQSNDTVNEDAASDVSTSSADYVAIIDHLMSLKYKTDGMHIDFVFMYNEFEPVDDHFSEMGYLHCIPMMKKQKLYLVITPHIMTTAHCINRISSLQQTKIYNVADHTPLSIGIFAKSFLPKDVRNKLLEN